VRERCFLNVSLYIQKKRIKEALLEEENKEREGIRKEAEKRRVQEQAKEETKEREEGFVRKEKVRKRFINNVFDKMDKGELLFFLTIIFPITQKGGLPLLYGEGPTNPR